jgi:hypothetical protein
MQMCQRCGMYVPAPGSTMCDVCAEEVQAPDGDERLAARAPHLNRED